jgi:ABC-2 type transport system ATP-binding protein
MVNGFNTLHYSSAARKSVGFVFNEERSFFWRLTGRQNLEFFGALDNLTGKELRDRIDCLIDLVGLEQYAGKPVSTYSSGMKQRLAMARGLITDPDVLILDEPTRALDPVACEEVGELIMTRIHQGSQKTLMIATHRPEEAMQLCNKVMVVHGGRLNGLDSIADLTTNGAGLLQYYRERLNSVEELCGS